MRVTKNKDLFTVITNEAGKIIKFSDDSISVLKNLSIGDNVFDIISADVLFKHSMYDSKAILTNTTLKDFPNAFMISRNKKGVKTVEICFLSKNVLFEDLIPKAKEIVSLYGENEERGCTLIDLKSYFENILDMVMSKKHMEGAKITFNGESREIKVNPQRLELIFLTTLSILNDINFKCEIEICLREKLLSFSLLQNTLPAKYDISSICEQYPQITSKLYLLKSICEDEGIELDIFKTNTSLLFEYNLQNISKRRSRLKAFSLDYKERIFTFIDILF